MINILLLIMILAFSPKVYADFGGGAFGEGGNGSSGRHIIQSQGTSLPSKPYLDFEGGIHCTNVGLKTVCNGASTPTWDAILSPVGPQLLDMADWSTTWENVSAFNWSGFTNLNFSGATLTSDSNISTTAQMSMGAFNMSTGATTNYVLTSDSAGNGSWQASTISGNQSCIALQTPSGTPVNCCVDNSFAWSCSGTGNGSALYFNGNRLYFNGSALYFTGASIPTSSDTELFFAGNKLYFNGSALSFSGTSAPGGSGLKFAGSNLIFNGHGLTFNGE